MRRLVDEARPSWVIGENVTHIDGLDLERVVSDLEALCYQVQTFEIPACAVGQDHWRARIWICGHANRDGQPTRPFNAEASWLQADRGPQAGDARAPDGISSRLDGHRQRSLGNAVVPQIPEAIGRAILAAVSA
jgi:site-specific DNA-cytosine methylase